MLAITTACTNNTHETPLPIITLRHEYAGTYEGNQLFRLVASANAPNGFLLLGLIISYDNSIIIPVHHETHEDIPSPTNTAIQSGTAEPFAPLISSFNPPLTAWLVRDQRTAFSFDVFTMGQGAASDTETDIFAFYYRVTGNDFYVVTSEVFRLEDGRNTGSMVGTDALTSFIRPGIEMLSGGVIYVWGHHTDEHDHTVIPDVNIVWETFSGS